MVEYNIGTCYGCRKCMYCGYNLNVEECECDKTVKPNKKNRTKEVPYAFTRNFEHNITLRRKTFIQTKKELYSYSNNLEKKFCFTLCSICNNVYQKLSNPKTAKSIIFENSNNSNFCDKNIIGGSSVIDPSLLHTEEFINFQPKKIINSQLEGFRSEESILQSKESINSQLSNNYKKNVEMQEQQISFTLIVKKMDGKLLPGKWLTFDLSTFKKFAIQIQQFIGITMGVDDIDQKEYSLAFKSAKSNGGGLLELSDSKDFEKFRNEYEKLHKLQKEIVVVAQMKQKINKKKKRKQAKVKNYFIYYYNVTEISI